MSTVCDLVLILDGNNNLAPAIVRAGSGTVDVLYASSSGWGPATGLTQVADVGSLTSGTYTPYHDANVCAAPAAGASVGLALSTARRPNVDRPTRVTVSGTWTASVTASATIELQSDSASTPTTKRGDAQPAVTLALGVGLTLPWQVSYDVPAGHYYRVVQSAGTGTTAITHVEEQTL